MTQNTWPADTGIGGWQIELPKFSSFKVILGGTVAAGDMNKINDSIGQYCTAGVQYDEVFFCYLAEAVRLPKAVGIGKTFSPGSFVYYDASAKNATNHATGNTKVGIALETRVAADTTVLVDFDGRGL